MSTTAPEITAEAEGLLRAAHQSVADNFDGSHPLTAAALHLINCAADAVGLLSQGDQRPAQEAAQHALGCARAAVTAATYALLRSHEDDGTDPA